MKKKIALLAALCFSVIAWAQNDSSRVNSQSNDSNPSDTLHIGNMTIIKNGSPDTEDGAVVKMEGHHRHNNYNPPQISTNWFILDLGFANYNDRTNYSSAAAQQFAPGSKSSWFDLNTGKSVDVNIWFFMQRLNVIKHVVNLKYGLGLELNNYRYQDNIKYLKNPTTVIMDTINYRKNKLAADYVTLPLMLNFNFTPHRRQSFGVSFGASAGYLYSSRQKLISSAYGKHKDHDSFDLNPWKISWIGEIQLGFIKLYGSYATKSMFKDGLDQVPYTLGIRLSNW